MTTMQLECPGCGTVLDLDIGFAGGVCRCVHCGTMMSVPELERGEAGGQVRLDRPGASESEADGGQGRSGRRWARLALLVVLLAVVAMGAALGAYMLMEHWYGPEDGPIEVRAAGQGLAFD